MPGCEKCWSEARRRAYGSGLPVADFYDEVLAEIKSHACTPKEQAGQWWDEARQRDTRLDATLNAALDTRSRNE